MYRSLLFLGLALCFVALGCDDSTSTLGGYDYSDPPAVGTMAPNFTQSDTSGKPVSLDQFRGKVVLLDFWATWCSPCVRELPNVKALWDQYRDQGLQIVSVSLDYDLSTWRSYIKQNDLDWVHVSDGQYWRNAIARQYGVTAIPQSYLIGRDGRVISEGIVIDEDRIAEALKK